MIAIASTSGLSESAANVSSKADQASSMAPLARRSRRGSGRRMPMRASSFSAAPRVSSGITIATTAVPGAAAFNASAAGRSVSRSNTGCVCT